MSPRAAWIPQRSAAPLPGRSWLTTRMLGMSERATATVLSVEYPSTSTISPTQAGIRGKTCARFLASFFVGTITETLGVFGSVSSGRSSPRVSSSSVSVRFSGTIKAALKMPSTPKENIPLSCTYDGSSFDQEVKKVVTFAHKKQSIVIVVFINKKKIRCLAFVDCDVVQKSMYYIYLLMECIRV